MFQAVQIGIGSAPGKMLTFFDNNMAAEKQPDEFIPTRASLLNRMKDWEDQDSWNQFFHIYRRLILATARKAGLTEQESEEVLQETVLSVAKTIQEFQYDRDRCRFKTWLQHLTRRRIADQFRKRPREQAASAMRSGETSATDPIERVADPGGQNIETVWEEEWQQKILDAAVERVKGRVDAEQYQIFDFYVLRKMPPGEVAAALGVSIGQVYLVKHRVSSLVKKEVKLLETKMG